MISSRVIEVPICNRHLINLLNLYSLNSLKCGRNKIRIHKFLKLLIFSFFFVMYKYIIVYTHCILISNVFVKANIIRT